MINAISVTVTASKNKYLKHPARGRMQVIEVFTDGAVNAAFQPGLYVDGEFRPSGGPVALLRPEFNHSPK